MTTKRSSRSRAPRRRTSRRVWVNTQDLASGFTMDVLAQRDLLASAETFMRFDSTILAVVFTQLGMSFAAAGGAGRSHFGALLRVGDSLLDTVDQPDPLLIDGIDRDIMWHGHNMQRTGSGAQTFSLIGPGNGGSQMNSLTIRTKRRIREQGESLWLVHKSTTALTTPTETVLSFSVRVLLLVP